MTSFRTRPRTILISDRFQPLRQFETAQGHLPEYWDFVSIKQFRGLSKGHAIRMMIASVHCFDSSTANAKLMRYAKYLTFSLHKLTTIASSGEDIKCANLGSTTRAGPWFQYLRLSFIICVFIVSLKGCKTGEKSWFSVAWCLESI